jgi:hypothetical protein
MTEGSPKAFSVEGVVSELKETEEPVMTIQEIADAVGVSGQSIRNYKTNIESHPDVKTDTVDRTSVFWHVESKYIRENFDSQQDSESTPVRIKEVPLPLERIAISFSSIGFSSVAFLWMVLILADHPNTTAVILASSMPLGISLMTIYMVYSGHVAKLNRTLNRIFNTRLTR